MPTQKKKFYDMMSWSIKTKAIITSLALLFGSITSIISFNDLIFNKFVNTYIKKQSKPLIDSLETKYKKIEINQRLIVIMLDDSIGNYQKHKLLDKVRKNLGME